ncbi:hypothetical protein HDZ31DRAFT_44600, partial [Schizophyllum fasciatum]
TRFSYSCAQLQARQRAVRKKEGAQPRDKGRMDVFHCDGWLHITIWESLEALPEMAAWIKLKHENDHIPYWEIDVPDAIQNLVHGNPELRPSQLWDIIVKDHGLPNYDRKSIYRLWAKQDQQNWRKHDDEKVSAEKLLQDAAHVKWSPEKGVFRAERITLPTFDGVDAFAFSLPDAVCRWKEQIREVAIDSAWNTNGSRYEVFALLGEVHGSGCPLGYLLIRMNASQDANTKEQYLTAFLRHFRDTHQIRPLATLSDKDWSEINACRAKRLPIKDRRPAFYDVDEAAREFSFIDKKFVPIAQITDIEVSHPVFRTRFLLIIFL